MKFKKIMLLFLFALPACITMRTLQLNFTVEEITGFFTYESGNYGKILLICIFAICLGTAIFSFFNTTKPQKPPKTNILLSISACLLGAAIFYETFFLDLPDTTAIWQILLLRLTGVLAGIYFIIYGLAPIWRFELPEVVSVFPTLYLIARMICDFTTISKLALISDNVILIVTYCVLLLFLLNYAKLYNKSDEKRNSKKLAGFGTASVILCFTNSIPVIIMSFKNISYIHTPMETNISLLLFGIFTLVFLLSHFDEKNLSE